MCVSVSMCFLFFFFVLFTYVCLLIYPIMTCLFYFILIYHYYLDRCCFYKKREKESIWIWVGTVVGSTWKKLMEGKL